MTALGVYVGNSQSSVYNFEKWLGREVDFIHAVVGYANWQDYVSSASWEVNTLWKGMTDKLHWSVPIISQAGNLSTAATGAYNSYYKQVAQTIANGTPGTDKIYIRTGWEANGSWFFWNAIGKEEAFKGAFQEFVESFRSVSDRFIFEWNVNEASGGIDPATIYPGDEYVDVIGMDFYWKPQYIGSDPVKAFNTLRDEKYGLAWLENFAAAHGKPTAYSEWGVTGDNAGAYIKLVKEWFDSHNVVLQSYWDSNSDYPGKMSDGSDPNSGSAYVSTFSGPSTVDFSESAPLPTPPVVEEPAVSNPPPATTPSTGSDGTAAESGAPVKFFSGTSGADSWTGTSGNDQYQSNGGGDTMKGGAGDDTYLIDSATDKVVELAGQGIDTVKTWINNYVLPDNVENLVLTGTGWNTLTGNALANRLEGNLNPNTLNGKGGNDLLTGGGGNDTFVIAKGEGHDTITDFAHGQDVLKLQGFTFQSFAALKAAAAQTGADTVLNLGDGQTLTLQNFKLSGLDSGDVSASYSASAAPIGSSSTPVVVSPVVTAPADSSVAESGAPVKVFYGTSGADNWTGTSGNDQYQSNGGGDTMQGGLGDDTYSIASATDKVVELAGQGVDTVTTWISSYVLPDNVENLVFFGSGWCNGTGNALANRLVGTDSPNVLNGKGGNDLLTGGGGNDTFVIAKGEGHDTITDFTHGQDVLKLQGFGAGSSLTHSGDVWTVHAADGSVQDITLTGVTSLASSDYAFV